MIGGVRFEFTSVRQYAIMFLNRPLSMVDSWNFVLFYYFDGKNKSGTVKSLGLCQPYNFGHLIDVLKLSGDSFL